MATSTVLWVSPPSVVSPPVGFDEPGGGFCDGATSDAEGECADECGEDDGDAHE
jgi:hypothetical protein